MVTDLQHNLCVRTYDDVSISVMQSKHMIWNEALQWRHNEGDGVSNHRRLDGLPSRLFRRRWKKTSKLRVTGLCEGNSLVTSEFPSQKSSNAENCSIWWRHHELYNSGTRSVVLPSKNELPQSVIWAARQMWWMNRYTCWAHYSACDKGWVWNHVESLSNCWYILYCRLVDKTFIALFYSANKDWSRIFEFSIVSIGIFF